MEAIVDSSMCFPTYMGDMEPYHVRTVSTQLPEKIRPDFGRSGEAGRRGLCVVKVSCNIVQGACR